jgi:hypothetical protein
VVACLDQNSVSAGMLDVLADLHCTRRFTIAAIQNILHIGLWMNFLGLSITNEIYLGSPATSLERILTLMIMIVFPQLIKFFLHLSGCTRVALII